MEDIKIKQSDLKMVIDNKQSFLLFNGKDFPDNILMNIKSGYFNEYLTFSLSYEVIKKETELPFINILEKRGFFLQNFIGENEKNIPVEEMKYVINDFYLKIKILLKSIEDFEAYIKGRIFMNADTTKDAYIFKYEYSRILNIYDGASFIYVGFDKDDPDTNQIKLHLRDGGDRELIFNSKKEEKEDIVLAAIKVNCINLLKNIEKLKKTDPEYLKLAENISVTREEHKLKYLF